MRPVAAGLYLHIPYCSAICPYCDFTVTTGSSQTRAAFLEGLEREIECWRDFPCAFDTVYFGPSAHSFHGRRRWWNVREAPLYLAKVAAGESPVAGDESLTSMQLALEAVMLRLRTTDGIDLSDFREQYGVDLAACNRDRIAQLVERGLAVHDGGQLVLTLDGLAVADGVAAEFALG